MKRTLPDWPCVLPDQSKDGKTFAIERGDNCATDFRGDAMNKVLHTRIYKLARKSHGKIVVTYRG